MDFVIAGQGDPRRSQVPLEAASADETTARILQLSGWMMILGTIRLICAVSDYVNIYLETTRFRLPSLRILGVFFQENPPLVLVGSCWPLLLGLLLRRSGNRDYLRAAALTFLVLSASGILSLLAGVLLRADSEVSIGSFTVSRWSLLRFQPASAVRAAAGVCQLALEFLTAIVAWNLGNTSPAVYPARAPDAARSRRCGRLAVYVSLAFLLLSLRVPAWSAYLAVLNRSSLLREFVLSTDQGAHVSSSRRFSGKQLPRPEFELQMAISSAYRLSEVDRVRDASTAYLRLIQRAKELANTSVDETLRVAFLSRASNNLAWLLTTAEDERFWQPAAAQRYAESAVMLAPEEGTYWNTLGVAHYRAGHWAEARTALEHSMALRGGGEGDGFDWFFLAMIEARLGRKEESRRWYDRASEWYLENRKGDRELSRFQGEAAALLGLPRPPAALSAPRRDPSPFPARPPTRRPPGLSPLAVE